jgi:hypothetical protein
MKVCVKMSKKLSHLTKPAICSIILCANTSVLAGELTGKVQTEKVQTNYSQQELISQVTSVSQLSDVQPGDWAFQSLQSLVERYGCVAGYPNGTYRGNRALTRYEFAAGLNACLDRVNELIATATADLVAKEDLATMEKLQKEFSAELAILRRRIDVLEARTGELEANQFSTTSKLQGQVVAVVSDVLSGDQVNGTPITAKNTTLGARARIEFVSSFTGKDTLLTRIESNNINTPDLLTREGNLWFQGSGTTNSVLGTLWYKFPLSEKTQAIAIATGGAADDVTSTVNILDGDAAFGALSTFGTRNAIYTQVGSSGLGVNHQFSDKVGVSLAYLAGSANNPASNPGTGSGLFDGPYGALAQLTVKPSDRITVGLTYINSYNTPLATGSNNATSNFFAGNSFSSNSYGVQASIGISNKFVLGGWGGYTNSKVLTGNRGDVDIWNYAVTLGFRDLGKKGNLAGIIVGMEPKVTSTSSNLTGFKDQNTSYHIEAFYQYKLNDNITITPGVIWLTAPDHQNNNDDVVIGALRTTFSF